MNLDKIKALAQRAVHEATPVEEARSCALIALRQIVAEGFVAFDTTRRPQRDAPIGGDRLLRIEIATLRAHLRDANNDLVRLRSELASTKGFV